jgi:hypothetical protein
LRKGFVGWKIEIMWDEGREDEKEKEGILGGSMRNGRVVGYEKCL